MEKSELNLLYKKYVENKYFYRVISNEYLSQIKQNGLTPKTNPFNNFKIELRRFYTIVENLEKKGFEITIHWAYEDVKGSRVTKVHRKNLRTNYIDLNPDSKHNNYYIKRKGGDLVDTTKYLAEQILTNKFPLTKEKLNHINKILIWCNNKSNYNTTTLKISKQSKSLQKAYFQHFTGGKYWKSPFGSFEHFAKIILKEGFEKYEPFLSGEKIFYLRTIKNVPSIEIIFQ